MSNFDDNFTAIARPALMAEHGQTVTLTSRAGAETSVTGIFIETTEAPEDGMDGRSFVRTATLQVSEDDIVPDLRYTATINSEKWDVVSQGERVGGLITLILQRSGVFEVNPGGHYRGTR